MLVPLAKGAIQTRQVLPRLQVRRMQAQALPPVPLKPQAPPPSGLTLHPYDLLKNPYQAKEKIVLLDLNSRPVLYDGAVIQYSGPVNPTIGARFGLMALRLDRMADENVALYNIMGIEAGESDGDTSVN